MTSSDTKPIRRRKNSLFKEKKLFDRALALRDEGNIQDAIAILKGLTERYPEDAASFGMLGGIYYEIGEFGEAIRHFKETTSLSPRSELASRGLFHSLLEAGRNDEAKMELQRYIDLTSSEEFRTLLRALDDNDDIS